MKKFDEFIKEIKDGGKEKKSELSKEMHGLEKETWYYVYFLVISILFSIMTNFLVKFLGERIDFITNIIIRSLTCRKMQITFFYF